MRLRRLSRDWLVAAGGAILVLTGALVGFLVFSGLPVANPIIGIFAYSLLPVLFVAGAVVFFLAILEV